MNTLIAIFIGGGLGSLSRFGISKLLLFMYVWTVLINMLYSTATFYRTEGGCPNVICDPWVGWDGVGGPARTYFKLI